MDRRASEKFFAAIMNLVLQRNAIVPASLISLSLQCWGFLRHRVVFACFLSAMSTVQSTAQEHSTGAKVAIIDIAYIFQNAASIKSEIADIEQQIQRVQQFGKTEQEKLIHEAERIKTFELGTAAYRQQEEKVASMESTMKLEMFRRRKQLADAEAALYFRNYQTIYKIVAQLAEYNKIDIVLRYDSEGMNLEQPDTVLRGVMKNVVYRADSIDLTQLVLRAINEPQLAAKQASSIPR